MCHEAYFSNGIIRVELYHNHGVILHSCDWLEGKWTTVTTESCSKRSIAYCDDITAGKRKLLKYDNSECWLLCHHHHRSGRITFATCRQQKQQITEFEFAFIHRNQLVPNDAKRIT